MVSTLTHNAAVVEKVVNDYPQTNLLLSSRPLFVSVGVLCGACEAGYGVSALLNSCVTCHDASGILIVILCKLHFPVYTVNLASFLIRPFLFPVTLNRCG